MLSYIKLHADALKAYRRLSDTEFGRAIRAVLQYMEDGAEPSLPGKESVMFDVLREQLERDTAEYERKCSKQRENGRKGGRPPRKPNETQITHGFFENPPKPNETQITQENHIEDDNIVRAWEDNQTILAAAEKAGFPTTGAVAEALIDLYSLHGLEKVLAGIKSCVDHSALNLAYLKACMQDKPRASAPDGDPGKKYGWL